MEIKDILRNKRIELGLTMKDVANKVGVSEGTVSRWESGEISDMRRSKIALLADVLQLSPITIMGLEDFYTKDSVPTDGHPEWYTNPETARLAQAAFDRPDLGILMDASADLPPESVLALVEIAKRMKGNND